MQSLQNHYTFMTVIPISNPSAAELFVSIFCQVMLELQTQFPASLTKSLIFISKQTYLRFNFFIKWSKSMYEPCSTRVKIPTPIQTNCANLKIISIYQIIISKNYTILAVYISAIMSENNRPTMFRKMDIYILIPQNLTRSYPIQSDVRIYHHTDEICHCSVSCIVFQNRNMESMTIFLCQNMPLCGLWWNHDVKIRQIN